jgi:long-chain acyl-CoA synthetase
MHYRGLKNPLFRNKLKRHGAFFSFSTFLSLIASFYPTHHLPLHTITMVQQVSVKVADAKPGETETRRSIISPDELLTTPAEGVTTLFDLLVYSAATYPDRNGFGYRRLEQTIQEDTTHTSKVNGELVAEKKTWTYYQLSGYHYYTYKQALDIATALGAGLKMLGLTKGDILHFFASTR